LLKLMSGRGYLFEADVIHKPAMPAVASLAIEPDQI
jgi:hypothetical protein